MVDLASMLVEQRDSAAVMYKRKIEIGAANFIDTIGCQNMDDPLK
jgi:hypothetical protein